MADYYKLIDEHYSRVGLSDSILGAVARHGKTVTRHEATATIDEFHIRGRAATRELAQLAGLQEGLRVIDLGCGIGGPARTLAAEFGCSVTGIDLVEEYCQTATRLTELVGLSECVTFRQGDALAIPFETHSFDVAWTAHVTMNISNKAKLFEGIRRVLKPGGLLILYEICAGTSSPPLFPVPWANNAAINFLVTPVVLEQILHQAGFRTRHWVDVSALSLTWIQSLLPAMASCPSVDAPPLPGVHLLMGTTALEKMTNMARNLSENRISVIQGVFQL